MTLVKIAYSGTHGTGKTTSVYKRAYEEKIDPSRQHQRVRVLVETTENCPFPINEAGTARSQWWMFLAHLKREIEATTKSGVLICDRTIIDPIAYTMYHGLGEDSEMMFAMALPFMPSYSEIIVKRAECNCYHYDDGVRSASPDFRAEVNKNIIFLYREVKKVFPKLNIIYD